MHKVPRQWLINVTYTLVGEAFSAWVKDEIASRNEDLARKQNLLIDMDPEIAKAFHGSVNISSRYHHFPSVCLLQALTIVWLCSIEWQQRASYENWVKAPPHAG